MKTFKKWNNKPIEDWGCVCSDDCKAFYRAFRNYLKRIVPGAELIGFKANHYDTSGFIKVDNRYLYISHAIERYYGKVNFDDTGAHFGVLYRSAENEKDYRGGANHFCSINELADRIKFYFDNGVVV